MPDADLLSSELRLAGRLDGRFFALLRALHASGSLRKAAGAAGYSYKGAWLLLEHASNLSHQPLIESATGGAQGGGTRLTAAGQALLDAWEELSRRHQAFLGEQQAWLAAQPAFAGLLRRLRMKTTARNQFAGTITALETGPVSTQVTLTLPGGQAITASLTTAAAKEMKLKKGREAVALVKASAVVLVTDFAGFVLSARNQLAGTISRIDRGPVSSLVALTLTGGAVISASVTQEGVSALGLAVGTPATAVFKAYSVMLAVEAG